MADILNIQTIAGKLSLTGIEQGLIDLQSEKLSNLDYIESILLQELQIKNQKRSARLRKSSKFPIKVFDDSALGTGVKWQLEQLSSPAWLEDEQNIIILGNCRTGKTSLACMLGMLAIEKGHKAYYTTMDTFLGIARSKEANVGATHKFTYMRECDLIVIDDVFYVEPTREELQTFYRAVSFLNETRSIIIVSNRELSSWTDASEDKHLCRTLIDRLTANSQIIRL